MAGSYVTTESEQPAQWIPDSPGTVRVTIDRSVGCQNLTQRVLRYETGRSPETVNDASEEVFYVISGRGRAIIDGVAHELAPKIALLVPPKLTYIIENPGPDELALLSILAPQPGQSPGVQAVTQMRPDGKLAISEDEEEALPAGDDRVFKLLINPRYGCRNLTQFVGTIFRGRSPDHTHTYEEVVYILSGAGIVHVGGSDHAIEAGSCIYLSPGTPHCLENNGTDPLRLLGVFCPAGSPAAKEEADTD